ncbi:hypothetical protein A3K34_03990 [candidate division WWE3 bacterium RIFOXYC1_FULL_40_10]|uniref:Uncharacterized protein n=1 Tax=candidate division WWE3 bacterium RIFOXYA2_FULL_46_9 TaxID=1802636 RepID=A0A1F4W0G9_UNCKA|nr:MAG: hypothetical protein A3K58_03990 [candidate division WWE3 bacterium RIFOXYB1_FULL_40_22]OGC62002.1 MAG: hypothetical protein A3K37_03990 [candidate division WWE3 bacterium RIFOXYA1_FULL_40_11]OGC62919.1 MAG: hypothetical protein A2264_03505 [candidate division WWE3 bacterium RIFOXYA2_FULL_46_9]OGC65055.1 MAG: hypothetical protein A2326_03390 [candidate division WWE3 bacterium RIFOXYB2_FULL_41_6]OGC66385.1 MAG: hypothetical protein A3K34_03990 [candidate division WWE3 bacterium RIFOXYC1_
MPIRDNIQTNTQHAVPQNIMDVEFKLIGDLTMRQFAYVLIFGGMAYLMLILPTGIFKIPLFILSAGLGIGLAFIPVEERGLDQWIVNFVKAVYTPTQRIWKKEVFVLKPFAMASVDMVRQEMITLAPTSSRRKLEEYLTHSIQKGPRDPLDIPEEEYISKVANIYASLPALDLPPPPAPVAVGVDDIFAEDELPPAPVISEHVQPAVAPPPQAQEPEGFDTHVPITPDMHSGRRFTSLLPSQGELFLPIRGEKVLSQDAQTMRLADEDVADKAAKLQQLLGQIQQTERVKIARPATPQTQVAPERLNKEAEDLADKLKEQNQDIDDQIESLKSEIETAKQKALDTATQEDLLKKLELEKSKSAQDYEALSKQIADLQKQLEEKVNAAVVAEPRGYVHLAKIPPLTTKPNIVSGVVGDGIPNVLLIIKNSNGEAVRAFKSNKLGQFILTTPLTEGVYTIEVSPINDTGLTFDIISVEVKGDVIPPIQITGR